MKCAVLLRVIERLIDYCCIVLCSRVTPLPR